MENASLGFHIGTTNLYLPLEHFIEHNTLKLGEANNQVLVTSSLIFSISFFKKKPFQP